MADGCPTMTVSFVDRDCDNPLGSVDLILPVRTGTTGSGAAYVMVDVEETSRRLREAMIAFAQAFDAS